MKKAFFSRKCMSVLAAGALACGAAQAQLAVTSPAFADGGIIPNPFTYNMGAQCNGNNWSPPLNIANIPAGTQTLVIVLNDTTVPWLHWEVWDIPVPAGETSVSLPYNAAASLPASTQAVNDFGANGYGGACPPPASGTHDYVFTVYALPTPAGGGQPSAGTLAAVPAADQGSLTGLRTYGDNVLWTPPGGGGGGGAGAAAAVPTLNETALTLLALLLAGATVVRWRRRQS